MPLNHHLRVLLADDSADYRAGIATLLKDTCEVVATLDDGDGIENAVARSHPDVVVLDVSMPKVDGFEAARRLLAVRPDAKIVFLTSHQGPEYQRLANTLGAQGFVDKGRAMSDLVAALQIVYAGGMFPSGH